MLGASKLAECLEEELLRVAFEMHRNVAQVLKVLSPRVVEALGLTQFGHELVLWQLAPELTSKCCLELLIPKAQYLNCKPVIDV